jgi:hypothetical protein
MMFRIANAISTLLLAAALTGESLWIDEGFSAWLACHRSFPQMLDSLRIGDSSDLEMLLHNVYLWCWVHLFGSSEYAMRGANLPFIALLVTSLAFTSRLAFRRPYAWMAIAVAPFFYVYANEARAYFPMMACAAASTGALLVYTYGAPQHRKAAAWLCTVFFACAMMFHMLAGFLLPAFAAILILEARGEWMRWWSDWWRPMAYLTPLFLLIGGYYGWTISRGEAYIYGSPSMRHLLSVAYDFVGFAGLGPSRAVLRHVDQQALQPYWLTLALGVAAIAGVALSRWSRQAKVLGAAFALGLATAIAASFAMNSLFLARHVSALFPLLMFMLLAYATRSRLILLATVWLISDLRIRSIPEYGKDDYRAAVQYVMAHNSGAQTVWAGDQFAAAYYGLYTDNPFHLPYFVFDYEAGLKRTNWPVLGNATSGGNWNPSEVSRALASARQEHKPVLLAMSKTDLYDVHKGWEPILKGRTPEAQFRSFAIYRIP